MRKFLLGNKKIFFIATLVISVVIVIFGVILWSISCDGSCNSSNHGGTNLDICSRFFFPTGGSILVILLGGLGIVLSAFFLWMFKKRNTSEVPKEKTKE